MIELPVYQPRSESTATRARLAQATGPRYWRSLEEYAQTPEFEELLHREFPSQLAVWEDSVGRRSFLKLMAASLALAGVTGCVRQPTETIVPYVKAPEEILPGKPLFYATALTRGGYARGVLVESHMGRPTKIEGNPDHPASFGATDAFDQASILSLYDPDRSQTVVNRGAIDTWDHFTAALSKEMERLRQRQGEGLRILTENVTSPTFAAQLHSLLEALPEATWHQYEPGQSDSTRAGARLAFGRDVDAIYHFDKADIVVSLDADFLSGWPGSVRYARDFIDRRRVSSGVESMNRLYVVESTPTLTGAMADHRLPLAPRQIENFARAIAARLETDASVNEAAESGLPPAWLNALVGDLKSHQGSCLVLAGPGQPPRVHALAHAINHQLGNLGKTVTFIEPVAARPESHARSLAELVKAMGGGEVDTLVIVGGNPVYAAPGELDFAAALDRVKLRIHLGAHFDETSFLCDWHIPAAHELEMWSDARAYDGTTTILQPLIAPLYDGKSPHELLAALAGEGPQTGYEILQAHWMKEFGEENSGARWRKAVHDGVVADFGAEAVTPELNFSAADDQISTPPDAKEDSLQIDIRPDPTIGDGRFANNGWLQELPKPLTKITWDNVALVSPRTAETYSLSNGQIAELRVGKRSVQAPIWIMPGQADGCVSLTFGYGRSRAGRVGTGLGYSAYEILPADGQWLTSGTLRRTGTERQIATTQQHYTLEGDDIIRVTEWSQAKGISAPEQDTHAPEAESPRSFYDNEFAYTGNAWGMVIDQTACIGCNACVVACQAENNIPVVGHDQVLVGRNMHWLRIDRYFEGELENPQTRFQPMLCQHCELAPCEVVCPVMATLHDSEGTSNMIYNRCVGTRYCSNNCPYKVRRFNYLQFSDQETPSLKLLNNPDVTVRSRGVMEKCSFCIQRINAGRIDAKRENRAIADGEVVTACQQVCPTRAIVFGNINDESAKVTQLKQSPLNYSVLGELNTRPRTTYLARVTNPHPDLRERERPQP
jgi:molybdopterin-containing oxidoreductase family iron-sulfur binding subunit